MKVKANAKINLYLNVLGKRNDGFHEIGTIIQEINLADILIFSEIPEDKIVLDVSGKFKKAPNDENIVFKAANLIKNKFAIKTGLKVSLEKNIPVGAGLGGGSSDAAATLKAVSEIWHLNISEKEFIEFAAFLGSDVPFFIKGGCAFATGRGEKIFKIENYRKYELVLVYPNINISTKEMYSRFNLGLTNFGKKCSITHLLALGSNIFYNKFEEVAVDIYPELKQIKNELSDLGSDSSLMSGSGSCIFGVFASKLKAKKARDFLSDIYKEYSIWHLSTL